MGCRQCASSRHWQSPASHTPGLGCPAPSCEEHLNFTVDVLVWSFCFGLCKEAKVSSGQRAPGTAWACPVPAFPSGVEVGQKVHSAEAWHSGGTSQ